MWEYCKEAAGSWQVKTSFPWFPVVPAIEFLSLICQELCKKDTEDMVGGIQSIKLMLLAS